MDRGIQESVTGYLNQDFQDYIPTYFYILS